jgi:hypothetical protein
MPRPPGWGKVFVTHLGEGGENDGKAPDGTGARKAREALCHA